MSQHQPRQQGNNTTPIRLIVGLGNPGAKYERTRHNAGFWFLDALARKLGAHFSYESKYEAEVARAKWMGTGEDVWLIKPQTFMNLSGKSVQPLMSFYRITPAEVLVAHDELDIAPATAKMKLGGGTGGHNGLTDIAERLGTKDYWRLRLGIGHPGHKDLVTGYVLGNAPRNEQELLDAMIDKCLGVAPYLEKARVQDGLTWLHTAFAPPKPPKALRAPRETSPPGARDDAPPQAGAQNAQTAAASERPGRALGC